MGVTVSYHMITQWLFLRLLGVVYCIVFASLFVQLEGLYGSRGITPISAYLSSLKRWRGKRFPVGSLFVFDCSDPFLKFSAAMGIALSLLLAAGFFPFLNLLLLWLLYLSFVSAGQEFLSWSLRMHMYIFVEQTLQEPS